jgi:hypothetical protein
VNTKREELAPVAPTNTDDLYSAILEQMRNGFAQLGEQIKKLEMTQEQIRRDTADQFKDMMIAQEQIRRESATLYVPQNILKYEVTPLQDAIKRNEVQIALLKKEVEEHEKARDLREVGKGERMWARLGSLAGGVAALVIVLEYLHILPK